jgi:hypothetical protein
MAAPYLHPMTNASRRVEIVSCTQVLAAAAMGGYIGALARINMH